MGFDLDSYESVQSRFSRFITWAETREQFFAVVSDLLSEPGADICVIKTTILCDGVVVATGHAEEVRGLGNVNKTSHVENCETSAIGRALANFPLNNFCGSSLDNRPSRDEMQKVQRMTTRQTDGGTITEVENKATDKQLNAIRAISAAQKVAVPAGLQGMTSKQASAYIDQLKNPQRNDIRVDDEEPFG